MVFANIPEQNFVLPINFHMVNTPNTSDPEANRDSVVIDGFSGGTNGFSFTFSALEGETKSGDLFVSLSTGLIPSPSGAVETGAEGNPNLLIAESGTIGATVFGFAVPEPSTLLLVSLGLIAAFTVRRRLQQ